MGKILVTGGTVFVSRFAANYFAEKGNDVYVLNRNSRPQLPNVTLIECDRHALGDALKGIHFDAVLDITAYTDADVNALLDGLDSFGDYILISSSAVYPETNPQPFTEDQNCGPNIHWGSYGTGKLTAEEALLRQVPRAYILRPPYLYGPMENLYRAPYIFECAEAGLPCPIPEEDICLQFFHVEDLCRMIGRLLECHPETHIFNVGNPESVPVSEWVRLCYETVGTPLRTVPVNGLHPRWAWFPFRDYSYRLEVSLQDTLLPKTKPLSDGLREEYEWFQTHRNEVNRKGYLSYIREQLMK